MKDELVPVVSVIIPVYNSGKNLPIVLRNIFNSQFNNFEVIVVNDASTDNTCEILKQFPCQVIDLPVNSGAGAARNEGAKKAKGDILLFIDSDIVIEKDTISKFVNSFSSQNGMDAIVGIYSKSSIQKNIVTRYKTLFLHFNHLSPSPRFWSGCGAIRKKAFNQIGMFDETLKGAFCEDTLLGYNIIANGYSIGINKDIQVQHLHPYSFLGLLKNDFLKTKVWLSILRKRNIVQNTASCDKVILGYYLNAGNFLSITSIYCIMLFSVLILVRLEFIFIAIIFLIAFLILNTNFYKLVIKEEGMIFVILATGLHIVSFLVAGIAVICVIVEYMVKSIRIWKYRII